MITDQEFKELFSGVHPEYLQFENIPTVRLLSDSSQLNLFMLCYKLFGYDGSVQLALHGSVGFGFDAEQFKAKVTKEQAIDMIRSGLVYTENEFYTLL